MIVKISNINKIFLLSIFLIFLLLLFFNISFGKDIRDKKNINNTKSKEIENVNIKENNDKLNKEEEIETKISKPFLDKKIEATIKKKKADSEKPTNIPIWLIIPFILLLAMIATGPLLYEKFWHKYYSHIAILLASIVLIFYIFKLKNLHTPIESFFEYVQFIALIASLYIASSGIFIRVNKKATPFVNVSLLFIGSLISNFIGTTGASMLLIKPFIRLNQGRLKVYHIIFFIFMISNVGGALTPIGDPPLFLGFLKGVPFFWTIINNIFPWVFALVLLGIIFLIFDYKNKSESTYKIKKGKAIELIGKKNFLWLILIILSVFLDPNIFNWVPSISYHGHNHSFLRELLLITIGFLAYKNANKTALKENEFSFEPLKEVIFIFIGIFGTMAPALEFINIYAQSDIGKSIINHNTLYWGAGTLSSFLDNAPTYLNFLTASMGSHGVDISNITDVKAYAAGNMFKTSLINLKAISISSVFFGAMTYIGNGPNFMVKSIADKMGIKMPTFFGYVLKYSIPILLPVLFLVWIIFFFV